MTLEQLPRLLLQNLQALGISAFSADQQDILRRFFSGGKAYVASHAGAGKLTAAIAALAALILETGREPEARRPPLALLVVTRPEDALRAADLFGQLTAGSGLTAAAVSQGRDVPRMRELDQGIDLLIGPSEMLSAALERSGIEPSKVRWLAGYRTEEMLEEERACDILASFLKSASPEAQMFFSRARDAYTLRRMAESFPRTEIVLHPGRWRWPDIYEEFHLIKRGGRLAALDDIVNSISPRARTMIVASRRRAEELAEIAVQEGLTAPGAFELYTPAMAVSFWETHRPRCLVATEVVAKLFPEGFFDLIIFADPPTAPEQYERVISRAAIRPDQARPWFGRAVTLFLGTQVKQFAELRDAVGLPGWHLLNPQGAKAAVGKGGEYVWSASEQSAMEDACWERLAEVLPEGVKPAHPGEAELSEDENSQRLEMLVPAAQVPAEDLLQDGQEVIPFFGEDQKSSEASQALTMPSAEPEAGPADAAQAQGFQDSQDDQAGQANQSIQTDQAAPETEAMEVLEKPAQAAQAADAPAAEDAQDAAPQQETAGDAAQEAQEVTQAAHAPEEEPEAEEPEEAGSDEDFSWIEAAYSGEEAGEEGESQDLGEDYEDGEYAEDEDYEELGEDEEDAEDYEEAEENEDGDDDEEEQEEEIVPQRRTLTIRSGYVPHANVGPAVTITEPLSSNTVELRAAQARMRREMKGGQHLTHQLVGKRGTIRRPKKNPGVMPEEAEGILAAAQPGKKHKAMPSQKKNRKGFPEGKAASRKAFKQGGQKGFKQRKTQTKKNAQPAFLEEAPASVLTLPMTAPAASESMLSVQPGDALPHAEKQPHKDRRDFRDHKDYKSRSFRSPLMKRHENKERRAHEDGLSDAPAAALAADVSFPPVSAPPSEAPLLLTHESAGDQAAQPAAQKPQQKKFRKPFQKKKPRPQAGEASAQQLRSDDRRDDDNFGNSVHYRPKPQPKAEVMPWQMAGAYADASRPATLSFAQTMPGNADRTGGLTVYSAGTPESRKPHPQRTKPKFKKGSPQGGRQNGRQPQGGQKHAQSKGTKKFSRPERFRRNDRRMDDDGSGDY